MRRRGDILLALAVWMVPAGLAAARPVTLADHTVESSKSSKSAKVDASVKGAKHASDSREDARDGKVRGDDVKGHEDDRSKGRTDDSKGSATATQPTGGAIEIAALLSLRVEANEDSFSASLRDDSLSRGAKGDRADEERSDRAERATKRLYQMVSAEYSTWDSDVTEHSDANPGADFQHAIWDLEDELTDAGTTTADHVLAAYAPEPRMGVMVLDDTIFALNIQQDPEIATVPEPGSLVLLGTGLLVVSRRRLR